MTKITRDSVRAGRRVAMRAMPFALFAALAAPPAIPCALAGDGLCGPGETTAFACSMAARPGARIAALCADERTTPWRLTYRFGTPANVELTYPEQGEAAAFHHHRLDYSGAGGDAVLFTHAPFTYALFYELGHAVDLHGVAVRKGDTDVASLPCARGSVDALTTDFFKGASLPMEPARFLVPDAFSRGDGRGRKPGAFVAGRRSVSVASW